jgi:hypothetical protein
LTEFDAVLILPAGVFRKKPDPLGSVRFPKDFRGEMLKRHVTLIDLAEGVQTLRGDD